MGTIVAARTNHGLAIAADCLNTVEELVHTSLNHADSCLYKIGESFIGLNCSYALQQLSQSVLSSLASESISDITLGNKEQVRSLFSSLFLHLKTQYQVIPQQMPHLPLETLPLSALLVNRHGIFKVDGSRSVYEHKKFWAIGSGEAFALGALHAVYNEDADPEALLKTALKACGTFEANRNREVSIRTIRLPNLQLANLQTTNPQANNLKLAGPEKEESKKAKVLMHRGPVSIRRGRKGKKKDINSDKE